MARRASAAWTSRHRLPSHQQHQILRGLPLYHHRCRVVPGAARQRGGCGAALHPAGVPAAHVAHAAVHGAQPRSTCRGRGVDFWKQHTVRLLSVSILVCLYSSSWDPKCSIPGTSLHGCSQLGCWIHHLNHICRPQAKLVLEGGGGALSSSRNGDRSRAVQALPRGPRAWLSGADAVADDDRR